MALSQQLKQQVGILSEKVVKAEKMAGKQIRQILKKTEKFRGQQMKKLHEVAKKAEQLKLSPLVEQVTRVKSQFETGAQLGLDLVLQKLDLPTRRELDRLNKKISGLQKRIDELEQKKSS